MPLRSRLASLWRNLFHRDRVERDLDDEVRAAFDLLVEEKLRRGLTREDARRAAALELGGVEGVKQQVRDTRSGASVDSLFQDVRYAWRALRRAPLFTATAALSLALAITGNAVVFSIADAYLFRAQPGLAEPQRLVEVGRTAAHEVAGVDPGAGFDTFSYPNYLDYRERQTVFEGLAAYHVGGIAKFGLGTGDHAVRVPGAYVSANYFGVLGVPMALGRGFLPEEERLDSPTAVTVMSERLWRTQFGGDPAIVGRSIRLNGRAFTVIGVTAAGFTGYGIEQQRLWVPITGYPDGDDLRRVGLRGRQWLMGIGRLKEGVTIEQARAEMARIGLDLQRAYPDDNAGHGVGVAEGGALPVEVRSVATRFVGLLFALVGLILLIACFNVAGMLLARGAARAPELGVRLALGAARHRIARLLVIESVLISLAGAVAGLVGAVASVRLLAAALPLLRMDVSFEPGIGWRTMLFSLVLAAVAGVSCGLLPVRAATRHDLTAAMIREGSWGTRRLRARGAFVVAQVALSVLLLVSALLLNRSIRSANAIDPGFAMEGVEVVGLDLRLGGYDAERGRSFVAALLPRIEALPAVEASAAARVVPLTREREGGRLWLPDEFGADHAIDGSQNIVTPGYFDTLGIRLLAGRRFDASDRAGAPAVAIVNETLARRAWPGADPIGKHFVVGVSRRPIEVVGLVRDTKYRTIGEPPTPFFYVPAAQRYEDIVWILMRPRSASAVPEVRALINELDPNLPITQAATLTEMTAFTLFPQRLAAWLAGIVATIGALLSAVGLYGVTAYEVTQRSREIGVRIVLGALRGQVLALVLRHAMLVAGAGTVLGLIAAAAVTRLLGGMLYGVQPLDPVSFAGAAAALAALALVATLIPARRATKLNPIVALRQA